MEKFDLTLYTRAIQQIALANKCSDIRAISLFIVNLAIMKEHYKGASHLNYAQLGQQWNQLPSYERIEQERKTKTLLEKPARGGRSE